MHAIALQEREKMQTELLRKDLEKMREELEDAESYIEQLEKKLEETRNSKVTAKENLGEVVSMALESMLRRNT
ncbi:MAG: hypothetical protein ICV79_18820, partial [Flavisolibacter sp.]|nr:hypothetical protein [Flavisolibacter sp.]